MASPTDFQKYDSALLGILQHEGEVTKFLDVVFGFLFRKTDFYHVKTEEDPRYGFPEGVAENMIKSHFIKYKGVTERMVRAALERKKENEAKAPDNAETAPTESNAEKAPAESSDNDPKPQTSASTSAEPSTNEMPKTQEAFQSNPESYNGAVRDKYSWSQNYEDLDIVIPVDKTIVKTDQVKVDVGKKSIYVSIVNASGETDVVIDGELTHEVRWTETTWSLEKGKCITISISKNVNFWFKALLTNEDEIDLKKIQPERSMADMAPDELAVINKLQFDEKQKRLGLPQSHELKVHEMLKQGWDAEGSPFKGQEFDPKMFNISPSSVQ